MDVGLSILQLVIVETLLLAAVMFQTVAPPTATGSQHGLKFNWEINFNLVIVMVGVIWTAWKAFNKMRAMLDKLDENGKAMLIMVKQLERSRKQLEEWSIESRSKHDNTTQQLSRLASDMNVLQSNLHEHDLEVKETRTETKALNDNVSRIAGAIDAAREDINEIDKRLAIHLAKEERLDKERRDRE